MTRLHLALLISLALHAMGLVAADTTPGQPSATMHNSLSVELTAMGDAFQAQSTQTKVITRALPQAVERSAPRTRPPTTASDMPHAVARIQSAVPPTSVAHTGAAPLAYVEPATGKLSADMLKRVKTHLAADLARHFEYPEIARRHGWEGRVILSMNVASDGQLQQMRIAHSSGFALLDDSALQSLHRVDHLTDAVALLSGRSLSMQIPVIYRLQGEP